METKLLNTIEELAAIQASGTRQNRRETLNRFFQFGKEAALIAIPAALLSAWPKMAVAATQDVVLDAENFLLKLEYLQREFYNTAISSGVIPTADLPVFQQIAKHNVAHVDFLTVIIQSYGGTAIKKPNFNFTLNGALSPFSVYSDFLTLSQAFSDLAVRAYKGQMGNLSSNNDLTTASMQIHTVEARHAAMVRRLRASKGIDVGSKAWITSNSGGTLPLALQPIYDREDNVLQAGVVFTGISTVDSAAATEAFDEPLTTAAVNALLNLFVA